MYKPQSKTSQDDLLARCENLYSYLVVVGWRNPRCTEIQDAKTILMTMIEAEQISFDLMQEIVEALDTAQALYIDAAKLYAAAWDVFIDIPIPFVAVDPPPAPSEEDTDELAAIYIR